jgi:hypothetical protein
VISDSSSSCFVGKILFCASVATPFPFSHLLNVESPYLHIYLVIDNERTAFDGLNLEYTNSWSFCLCVSLERLATLVLSLPEGVVEPRTSVHPVRAFTSIGRDCLGCFIGTWKGDFLGSSSRGQPRGALPLH